MKKTLFLICLCASLSHAGEHYSKFDEFTGKTNKGFVTTEKEAQANRALYVINNFNKNKNTVSLTVQPLSGATSCDKKYLLLKDSAGVVHKIDATERGMDTCIVFEIDVNLVDKPFKVRIPMHSRADLDIEVDTSNMDLSRL